MKTDFYRFDEGQRESIRRIISAAKSMLSRNAISRAGEGLPSSAASFLHAKIAAKGSFATLVHFFFHRGFSATIAAEEGNYSLLLLLPLIRKRLDRTRPMSSVAAFSTAFVCGFINWLGSVNTTNHARLRLKGYLWDFVRLAPVSCETPLSCESLLVVLTFGLCRSSHSPAT